MADPLSPLTALLRDAPLTVTIGPCRITERSDVALASVAVRRGREADLARAATALGLPLADPARHVAGMLLSSFWVAPGMWFVEAPFDSHEDIVAALKPGFGDAASVTEQTDAWVRLDVTLPDPPQLFERLCNADLARAGTGFATRTVIEHLGCYLIRRTATEVVLYGPRSSAQSLLHALETAAKSVF